MPKIKKEQLTSDQQIVEDVDLLLPNFHDFVMLSNESILADIELEKPESDEAIPEALPDFSVEIANANENQVLLKSIHFK